MENRNIVNFYELSTEWQKEALSNLDEAAYEASYLEPLPSHVPGTHILWDLSECVRAGGVHDGFTYNAVMGVSNNSGILLNIDDTFETCLIKFV